MKKPYIGEGEAIRLILDAGLTVVENSGACGGQLTILGGVRRVQFWASTGAVWSDPQNGKPSASGSGIKQAIRLAKIGRVKK